MNAERCHRHLYQDASCNACGAPVEDILHVLRDWPRAIFFWNQVIPDGLKSLLFSLPLRDWMETNLNNFIDLIHGLRWNTLFGVAIWRLWNCRNANIFNPNHSYAGILVMEVLERTGQIISAFEVVLGCCKVQKEIQWIALC